MLTFSNALFALLLGLPAVAPGDTWKVPVKPEEPDGYAANPSTLSLPLRQDLKELRIDRLANGRYRLALEGGPEALTLAEVDAALLLPRVPAYARANEDLFRFALLQREFNRNEVKFGPVGEIADFKLANNCLRTGLWEIMLDKKVEQGTAMTFHGWFTFPHEEHARLFETLNGRTFAECERLVAQYPTIDGMGAPLDALRSVTSELSVPVKNFAEETAIRFGEQKRKAKLVLTPGLTTYADFSKAANQPIRVATFSEPGFYDPAQPVAFDLSWLAKPTGAVRREVRVAGQPATEVEIAFANGRRLVLGDRDLARLAPREQAPDNDKDTLRLTFGIGTPDIYASLAERSAERDAERPNWLFLLGPDGKHVDNHQAGVDRVFCWNERDERLHLYLVGYERIAVVAHLAVPLGSQ